YVLQFDFVSSIRDNFPVFDHIKARFAITLELSVISMIFSIFWGLLDGIISAVRKYTFEDVAMMVIALFGLSMPNFWLGLMLIRWFAIEFPIFKPSAWCSLEQYVLLVISFGTACSAIIARITRSSMLDVIDQDYIRTARAKGVKEGSVILRHALKNALIPVITVVGIQFGSFLAGSVLTE